MKKVLSMPLFFNTIKISFFLSSDELMHSLRETLKIVKDIPHILKVEEFHLYNFCSSKTLPTNMLGSYFSFIISLICILFKFSYMEEIQFSELNLFFW